MHLTMNTSMDLRRIVPLVLRATGNDHYVRHTDQIVADVAAGQPIHVAFARSRAFPARVPRRARSGRGERPDRRIDAAPLEGYEEEAESAVKTLATVFGFLVGLLVMALIVLMIFRLAGFYFGTINSLLDNKIVGFQLRLDSDGKDVSHGRQPIADRLLTDSPVAAAAGLVRQPSSLDVLVGRPAQFRSSQLTCSGDVVFTFCPACAPRESRFPATVW